MDSTPRPARTSSLLQRAGRAFLQEAKEFCLLTGLHGYKYIVQPGKHAAERWVAVHRPAASCCQHECQHCSVPMLSCRLPKAKTLGITIIPTFETFIY